MRILYFAPRECLPPNTGAKLRNYHLARELGRTAEVTYLGFRDEGSASSQEMSACNRVISVEHKGGYSFAKMVRGLIGRTPLPVLNYTTREMKEELRWLLVENDFDAIQVEGIHLLSYLPIIRSASSRAVIVCDWHNIESELMRRYSQQTTGARKFYARVTARKLEEMERRAMREFDAHTVVSERDRNRLLEIAPRARVFLIENGVDTKHYSDDEIERAYLSWSQRSDAAERNRLLFVGSMDYHANIDAVVSFAHSVWPAIQSRHPRLIFTIVGRNPSPEVRSLTEIPNVEVTGTVEDTRPYYREALASLVPLRVGSGSRLKILESMAAGVPVISTRLGAEGLDVTDGENILIAETAEEFSRAIADLSRDDSLRSKLKEAGRSLVQKKYDWSAIGAELMGAHLSLMGRR
ncbi:MAG: glycosyltransferase family 4 protein [Acidobacteriota bacterium]